MEGVDLKLLIVFASIPLAYVIYILFTQRLDNRRKLYRAKIILPVIDEEEVTTSIQKMRNCFDVIHNLCEYNRLSIELYKTSNTVELFLSSTSKDLIEAVRTQVSLLGETVFEFVDFDPLNTLFAKMYFGRNFILKNDFKCIKADKNDFLESLISLLSTTEENTAISFTLRGIHVQEIINDSIIKRKTWLQKRNFPIQNDPLLIDLENKLQGKMYLVRINALSESETVIDKISSIIKSLGLRNSFLTRKNSNEHLLVERNIPLPYLFFHLFRKFYGSYLNSIELASLIHPIALERGTYSAVETKIIESTPDFLEPKEGNILIGSSKNKDGSKASIYFPVENLERHMYLLGKTGMGKSTLLMLMFTALSNMNVDRSLILLDPHGSDLIKIAQRLETLENTVYFNLGNPGQRRTITYNPLFAFKKSPREKDARVEELLSIFVQEALLKDQNVGPSTELLLRKSIETAINFPDGYYTYLLQTGLATEEAEKLVTQNQITINDLEFIFNPNYKYIPLMQEIFKENKDDIGIFWNVQFNSFAIRNEELIGLRNRIHNLIYPSIRTMFEGNKFQINSIVEEGKNLLIPLTVKSFGKVSRRIFAKLLLAELWFNRQFTFGDVEPRKVTLFVDEFQNVQMNIIEELLAEARKFKIEFVAANQYISQLTPNIKNAVMGNVASIFAFNSGNMNELKEVPLLFKNKITETDIASLPAFTAFMKTLNPERNKDVALMSYETLDYDSQYPLLHSAEKLDELNRNALETYGEDIEMLSEKMRKKQSNAMEYFLKDLPV